jgi:hypothetical protein
MKSLTVLALLVGLSFTDSGVSLKALLDCTIRASSDARESDLRAMAMVTLEQARKTALDEVNARGSSIRSGELEVEDGCLIYSFGVKVPGKSGSQEVLIDAGTGRVLSVEHETAAQELAERITDKVKDVVRKTKGPASGGK